MDKTTTASGAPAAEPVDEAGGDAFDVVLTVEVHFRNVRAAPGCDVPRHPSRETLEGIALWTLNTGNSDLGDGESGYLGDAEWDVR